MSLTVYTVCLNFNTVSCARLLDFVNGELNTSYTHVEQLCDGAAYCHLVNKFIPGAVPINKIKLNAVRERDFVSNLEVLQKAFIRMGVSKIVPIEKLIKGRYRDNFEFMKWLMKFVIVQSGNIQYHNRQTLPMSPLRPMPTKTRHQDNQVVEIAEADSTQPDEEEIVFV